MKLPNNWEQELMIHSYKMMKLTQHQIIFYNNFYGNVYTFPNGIKVESARIADIKIYVHIEFSGMVESLLEDWKSDKKDASNDIVEFSIKSKESMKEEKLRKDFEDLLWDLYSLGS